MLEARHLCAHRCRGDTDNDIYSCQHQSVQCKEMYISVLPLTQVKVITPLVLYLLQK
jgi:hypothetical protein